MRPVELKNMARPLFVFFWVLLSMSNAAAVTLNFNDIDGGEGSATLVPADVWNNGSKTISGLGGVKGLSATVTSTSTPFELSDRVYGDAFAQTPSGDFIIRSENDGTGLSGNVTFSFNFPISGSIEKLTAFGDTATPETAVITVGGAGAVVTDRSGKSSTAGSSLTYSSANADGSFEITSLLSYSNVSSITFTYSCVNTQQCGSFFEDWVIDELLLTSSTPADDANAIALDANIVLNFSEAVDAEFGNITIRKTADDSVVETIGVTSAQVSGSGSNTITVNPSSTLSPLTGYYLFIDDTAFDNGNGQSYLGIPNKATLNFITRPDNTPPTIVISALEVSDGDSSDDASLSMTFTANEATADFTVGDITVTNGAISNFVAVSSTVYTATFTPTTMGATTIDVAAGTFTDTAGNNNTAAAQFNWTYSLDPTLKADVVAGLLSKELIAYQFYKGSLDSVNNRLAWLASRRGNSKTSKQGIAFKFTDPVLNQMLNSSSKRLRDYDEADIAAFASTLGGHSELYQDALKAEAISLGIAELKAKTGVANLNPELESMNNGWSIWSDGEISFGKNGASTMASSRKFNRTLITVGFDKSHNRNSLLGFALSIGQEDADIGSDGSSIQSDNIGATLYTSLTLENYSQIEASVGQTDLTFDTKRIDGNEVLTGERKGSVYYGSIGLRPPEISHDSGLAFSTHARLNLGQIILDQYSEGGGSMALTYLEQRIDYEELDTSVEISKEKSWGAITLRPRAMVHYKHFLNKSSTAAMHYVSSSQVYGLTVPTEMESGWGVSTGIDAFNDGNLSSSLALSRSQSNSENYTNSITFGLRYSF
jgi:hypothetical protein